MSLKSRLQEMTSKNPQPSQSESPSGEEFSAGGAPDAPPEPNWESMKVDDGEAAPPEPDAAALAQEKARREVCYRAIRWGLLAPNFVRQARDVPPLKSLDIANYRTADGRDLGRAASDQIYAGLMELPWFVALIGNASRWAERYGAVLALGLAMAPAVRAEMAAAQEADTAPTDAANDNQPSGPEPHGEPSDAP